MGVGATERNAEAARSPTEDMSNWEDLIVGDRMAVDREFSARVAESEFSSQQWGLVMTAVEFDVEHADDPDRARLVADTSKVEQIVPELESIDQQMGAMGPAGAGRGGPQGSGSGSGSGFLGSVKDALGLGGGDAGGSDAESVVREADQLTGEYADLLQDRLENEGKWEQVRSAAAGGTSADRGSDARSGGGPADDTPEDA